MARETVSRASTVLARAILGSIFALSAAAKLSAPGLFQADVTAYHLLPAFVVGPLAFALPWIEAMLAVYLLLGLFLRPAAVLAGGLLLVFTAALSLNLASGNVAHGCGCLQGTGILQSIPGLTWLFGGLTITAFDVARDLVLVALAAVIYWGDRAALSLDGVLFSEDPPVSPSSDVARPTPSVGPARLTEVDHGRAR